MDSVSHDISTKHHQSSSHKDKPVKHYSSESIPSKHNQPSSSELLSSAKLVADAAKSTFSGDSDHKVDKAKVAHAAGDLLGAASHYSKLEEKGYGKVIGQAENYLHKYGQNPHSTTTTTTTNSGHSAASAKPTANSSSHHSDGHGKSGSGSSHHSDGHGKCGSGSSHHNDGHGKSGNGYGDYINMAEGLFKKH